VLGPGYAAGSWSLSWQFKKHCPALGPKSMNPSCPLLEGLTAMLSNCIRWAFMVLP
jgi:hypothetical protein